MKESIFKITVVLLFLAGIFSCSENSDTEIIIEKAIIGKWKLVKIEVDIDLENGNGIRNPTTFDYSQDNIIYEFKKNNVLTISGSIDKNDYRVHEAGDHFYEMVPFTHSDTIDVCAYQGYFNSSSHEDYLIIDNVYYSYPPKKKSKKILELSYNYEDYKDYPSSYYYRVFTYCLIKI